MTNATLGVKNKSAVSFQYVFCIKKRLKNPPHFCVCQPLKGITLCRIATG